MSDIGCSFIVDVILSSLTVGTTTSAVTKDDSAFRHWTKATNVDGNVPSADYSELILKLIFVTQTHVNFELNQTHNSDSLR